MSTLDKINNLLNEYVDPHSCGLSASRKVEQLLALQDEIGDRIASLKMDALLEKVRE